MKKWNLRIRLISDLCTATGEDAPGITNIKTATEHGIPYIPAKRIKGCLLNEGKEMRDNGLIEQTLLDHIFGRKGARCTEGVCIGDAHLCYAPGYLFGDEEEQPVEIKNYKLFQEEVQRCQNSERAYFEEFFTRMRTRTAMDAETGSAKNHSLRTMQVVPAGVEFICSLEGELNAEEEKVLKNCAKGLRHMGVGITRGFGEVQCVLETISSESEIPQNTNVITDNKAELLEEFIGKEEVVLNYELTLDSPMVIEGTGECLPGSMMRGALAGMFIKKFSLGGDAHRDGNFKRIFLHDGVQFGYGFLKRGDRTYFPCPKAIAEMKEDKGRWFSIESDIERKRKDINGLVRFEGKELHQIYPLREVHFHHARPVDRGIGHATNDRAVDTSIPTGEFFQYTALTKGQTFAGSWIGKAEDMQRLLGCLQDNGYQMSLGKSKTAEYGKCTFKIVNIMKKKGYVKSKDKGTEWMLWFISPMISQKEETGEYTLAEDEFKKQLASLLGCKIIHLKRIAGGYRSYSGYNSKWRMPSVSCPAVETGTTYYLKTDREICSCEILMHRWGVMTGIGCGQATLKPWNREEEGKIIFDFKKMDQNERKDNNVINRLLCFRNERLECKKIAIKKLDGLKEEILPPSSSIELLTQILRGCTDRETFYTQVLTEAEHIHRADKKQKVLEFLKPCEGETYEFMKLYLENAKWKARCRSKDE